VKVTQTPAVDIAIRSLAEDGQRQIAAWIHRLRDWENDPVVREHSEKLPSSADVYVLKTSKDGYRIFFRLEPDRIKLLDIASKSTIMQFSE
jgi:hypothetical protein